MQRNFDQDIAADVDQEEKLIANYDAPKNLPTGAWEARANVVVRLFAVSRSLHFQGDTLIGDWRHSTAKRQFTGDPKNNKNSQRLCYATDQQCLFYDASQWMTTQPLSALHTTRK